MEEESAVAWNWVIEALARSDLVDAPLLLHELGPPFLGEFGIAAIEAVALRCLEGLCASSKRDVPVSEFHFDPSHTCQHVLDRVCHQTHYLQRDASKDLKCGIQTFVNLKKPKFSSSSLELLKNMILDGNHPFLEEISGVNIPSNFCDPMSTSVRNFHPGETLLEQVNKQIDDRPGDVKISSGTSGLSKLGTNGVCIGTASHDADDLGKKKRKLQHSVFSDVSKLSHETEDESNRPLINGNQTRDQQSLDDGGCHHHQTDATMSKDIFSRSQCVFNEYSIALTDKEANLCMKCNEGGQLLSCSGTTCPLFFHETCLGSFLSFDGHGNFYCPICACSRAVSDYVKAKENVSRARRELTVFIGGGSNNMPKHDHSRSLDDDVDQPRNENEENVPGLQNGADAAQFAKSHLTRS